jgi:hypothetical protein
VPTALIDAVMKSEVRSGIPSLVMPRCVDAMIIATGNAVRLSNNTSTNGLRDG